MDLPPVVQQGVFQHHALGQEEGEAGTLVPEHKEAQLLAQTAVVPLLGLLDARQILVQLLLLGEGNAIDALEGLPVGVAPPVGGVAGGELQGVALHPACGVQMRPGAQVGKLSLLVEGNDLALGEVVDELHLKRLALVLHELKGLGPGQFEPLQLQLLLADLPHFALDLLQMLGGKGEGGVHVVIPPLVNGGADGQLHLRPKTLHRLGHDVGASVPIGLAVGLVFKGIQGFLAHGNDLLLFGGIIARGGQNVKRRLRF